MEEFAFHKGLIALFEFIGHMNKYIDQNAPWTLAKEPESKKKLETVIYNLLEGLRVVSGLIYPIMPESSRIMQMSLGLKHQAPFCPMDLLKKWRILTPGASVSPAQTLFPRIEEKKVEVPNEKSIQTRPFLPYKPEISFEEFQRIDLRAGTIISAEKVKNSKKLLKVEVDIGEKRTVVAGISESYTPEEIIGKQVIVVANLKPTSLMGVESKGMLLAAALEKGLTLSSFCKKIIPGTPVK